MKQTITTLVTTAILGCLLASASAATPPPARWASNCVRIGNSIYCYGGDARAAGVDTILSDVWELSTVNNFDLSNPTWINIAHEGSVDSTPAAFDIMVPLIDGFSFLINGGLSSPQNVSEANQTSVFSTITKQWTAINSTTIAQTRQHRAVIDVNGRVWCWGGFSDPATGHANVSYWEGFAILDTVTWQWSTTRKTTGGYLSARAGHSMTILPNGFIYIIGGYVATMVPGLDSSGHMQWRLDLAPMGNMAIYDTVRGTWTSKITAGSIPAPRTQHSAVLAGDSTTIIIFGGSGSDTGTNLYNDLYTYNTNMASWTHIEIPNGPSPRYGHSGVQFNETMFVLFGLDSTNQSLGDIYALDTVNWKWITQFNPNGYPQQPNGNYTPAINTTTSSSGSSSPTASSGGGLTAGPIAGIAVGGIALLGAVGIIAFCLRRRNRNQRANQALTMEIRNAGIIDSERRNSNQRDLNDQYAANLGSPYVRLQDNASFVGSERSASQLPGYHAQSARFISKPDTIDVPHYILQSKPDEFAD